MRHLTRFVIRYRDFHVERKECNEVEQLVTANIELECYMFPFSWILFFVYLGVRLAIPLVITVFLVLLTNRVFKSPLHAHLLSSLAFCIIGFTLSLMTLLFWPGTISEVNGEPRSFHAWLMHNATIIGTVVALLFVIVWQIIVRRRRNMAHV
jgi:hypothetical protein